MGIDYRATLAGPVTAIIPTFNRADYLPFAIQSVLAQGSILDRVIVCDDGSTDRTAAVAKQFGPEITYIYQPNAGKAAAINHALGYVSSPYTWIADDDDIALPGAVARLAAALDRHPGAALAYGTASYFRDTPRGRIVAPVDMEQFSPGNEFLASLIANHVLQQASLFRTETFAAVGPFDPSLLRSVDWDYVLRVTARFPAVFVPVEVFLRREHDGVRGPAADRFPAEQRESKWATYDRIVIEKTLRDIPVERFSLVPDAGDERMLLSAHLVRAVVACRKAAWEAGLFELDKFVALANTLPSFELTASEKACLAQLFGPHSQLLAPAAPQQSVFERFRKLRHPRAMACVRGTFLVAFAGLCLRYARRGSMMRTMGTLRALRQTRTLRL